MPDIDSATQPPETAHAAPQDAKTITITLNTPIVRANGTVASLTLRKPLGGDLRGTTLKDLMAADINAIIAVVPRISAPFVTEQEVASLEADDFAEVGGALNSFFYTPAQKAMIAQMTGG